MYRAGTVVATVLMAGCTATSHERQAVGMPNPASAHCVEIGGSLTIEDTARGQVGICTLADGTRIEEWELFRRDRSQDQAG